MNALALWGAVGAVLIFLFAREEMEECMGVLGPIPSPSYQMVAAALVFLLACSIAPLVAALLLLSRLGIYLFGSRAYPHVIRWMARIYNAMRVKRGLPGIEILEVTSRSPGNLRILFSDRESGEEKDLSVDEFFSFLRRGLSRT